MHGEYKVPGGKLVVVDFEVVDGHLRNVLLSGDFFLDPDDALAWMTDALEAAPADLSPEELTERVRLAAGEAELIGVTPAGIVVAVQRALGRAA